MRTSIAFVRARSLIGPDAPGEFLRQLTQQLASEFSRVGTFREEAIVDGYDPRVPHPVDAVDSAETFRTADSLDAPLRPDADLAVIDRERQASARAAPAKGNKLAQLLFLNLGDAVVTVPSLLSPRTALRGIAEGLVDQITRRKVAAEQ